MRNQPFNSIFSGNDVEGDSFIDPPAAARFRILAALFVMGAIIVLSRIAWVQAKLQGRYLEALNTTTIEYELIPARDGRILAEGSEVFATDLDQYSVQIHYRWLQQPMDQGWLKRQILNSLSRSERKNAAIVKQLETSLETKRQDMWQHLMQVTKLNAAEFESRRASIQTRVTRIADSVNRRRQVAVERKSETTDVDGTLMKFAAVLRTALTAAPQRTLHDRVAVREEESWHEIAPDVPLNIAGQIREQSHLFPGVRIVAGNRRIYPLDSVAPHIVGARTRAKDDELSALQQSISTDTWRPRVGRFGIERSYNHQLLGLPGLQKTVRNRRMEVVESEVQRQPVSGRDVLLTLNVDLQKHAECLLAEVLLDKPTDLLAKAEDTSDPQTPQAIPTGGSVVVMDITTGRIIAAASAPGFQLSLYTNGSSEDWNSANADQRHPFLSRVIQTALPPGSIMKPITAAAAIETGAINPDEPFHCQGFLTRPDEHRCMIFRLYGQGHNSVTLSKAIAESCNVYFFAAAQKTGFAPLRQWCDRFGLGRKTGIDLPFETNGNLPGTSISSSHSESAFHREALGLAIGQSSVTVTPIQMVRAFAAIANGGWLVTPHVVSPDGTARITTDVDDRPRDLTRRKITGLSETTLERIREGMKAVVQEPYGTGYKTIRLDEVAIAGKTGTAETKPGRPDHAWFAGYVPADRPRYALAVVLENGGSGSRATGPVVRQLVRRMHELRLWGL